MNLTKQMLMGALLGSALSLECIAMECDTYCYMLAERNPIVENDFKLDFYKNTDDIFGAHGYARADGISCAPAYESMFSADTFKEESFDFFAKDLGRRYIDDDFIYTEAYWAPLEPISLPKIELRSINYFSELYCISKLRPAWDSRVAKSGLFTRHKSDKAPVSGAVKQTKKRTLRKYYNPVSKLATALSTTRK